MTAHARPLAVVTGASSGIGFELARMCAEHGFDLILAADEPLDHAVETCRRLGATVETALVDLAMRAGVETLVKTIGDRTVDALLANAGHGLGQGFLDQDFEEIQHVIDTNITGTLYLIHQLAWRMRERAAGKILITGSVASFMPGTYHAVYNGSKAVIVSFSYALRAELKESGVTVTCLMPGATETEFFERAGLQDTKIAQDKKDDPADVAKDGFDAMMRGDSDVVSGWKNKVQTTIANVTPAEVLAEQHRKMTEPGSGRKKTP
jgi:short-subunit dehydrogenase